jgi:outer membrane receptor for ferrienterochelin and colicins
MRAFLLFFCLAIYFPMFAQKDSLRSEAIEEVVVTATRSERQLSAVSMPVSLISKKQIEQIGSLRLSHILQEQTGLAIINDHGEGIQLQGFNPDYTLILIDGEPLIGRTAGTLELSRIAVGNIKQIEIIKGASSSLYGSEALAGVVNIITENPQHNRLQVSARYGANRTSDLGLNWAWRKQKFSNQLFFNRYASAGYDFTPQTFGQTVEPFHSHTFQNKVAYEFSPLLRLGVSARYFRESQSSRFDIGDSQKPHLIAGEGRVEDFNFNPTLEWRIHNQWKIYGRLYHSHYSTQSQLNELADNSLFDKSFFRQNFLRPELQTEYFYSQKHIFTLGAGNIWESVEATRYEGKKYFQTQYVFFQHEYTPSAKWNMTLGARYDRQSVYGSQFSPKFSIQYQISPKLTLQASVGRGFKAPDFRQLYLNFTNAVAGYAVFGTEELPNILEELQKQNQIAEILLPTDAIGVLKAERSWNINAGGKWKITEKISWDWNFFRNDVSNLIESQIAAIRTNGQTIFSYRNLRSIFTQGLETNWSYKVSKHFSLVLGYQYLGAKDKDVLARIDKGEVFRRNPQTLQTERLSRKDYGGLFGRSKNMANLKLFYEGKKGFTANLRVIYRGRYGFGDRNGNLVLDEENEYVQGYATLNLAASQEFYKKKIRGQVGIDNLLNYNDFQNIPNLPGRLVWASVQWNIF